MAAKKSAKKRATKKTAKKSTKKAAKKSTKKKGELVAKVNLPKLPKGYGRFIQGDEIRQVKLKRGGTKGARHKCKS